MNAPRKTASDPTIKRLPLYLGVLRALQARGEHFASGALVARTLELDPIVVRKDLASSGVVGRPRIGFPIRELISAIEEFLGWTNTTDAFLAGVGSLGLALMGYEGFRQNGLKIVAGFDLDPEKIGRTIKSRHIYHIDELSSMAYRQKIRLGILTVPGNAAQAVAQQMVKGGILGIWNFTPIKLDVPDHIVLQREDLAGSLGVLSHKLYLQMKPS